MNKFDWLVKKNISSKYNLKFKKNLFECGFSVDAIFFYWGMQENQYKKRHLGYKPFLRIY